jgi:hypothetical protein
MRWVSAGVICEKEEEGRWRANRISRQHKSPALL